MPALTPINGHDEAALATAVAESVTRDRQAATAARIRAVEELMQARLDLAAVTAERDVALATAAAFERQIDDWRRLADHAWEVVEGRNRVIAAQARRYQRLRTQRRRELAFLASIGRSAWVALILAILTAAVLLAGPILSSLPIPGGW